MASYFSSSTTSRTRAHEARGCGGGRAREAQEQTAGQGGRRARGTPGPERAESSQAESDGGREAERPSVRERGGAVGAGGRARDLVAVADLEAAAPGLQGGAAEAEVHAGGGVEGDGHAPADAQAQVARHAQVAPREGAHLGRATPPSRHSETGSSFSILDLQILDLHSASLVPYGQECLRLHPGNCRAHLARATPALKH
jgi:hypothetical protein